VNNLEQKRKRWKTGAVLLILVWIILFASSMYLLELLLATFTSNPQGQSIVSTGWAGYLVTRDLKNPNEQVTGINASWTVPRIGAVSKDAYSSTWIGIGGHSEKTLIQVGTEHDSVNGQEYYYAWYEMLPDIAVRIDSMSVYPGDLITASIILVNSNTNEWAIRIYDLTNGKGFYRIFNYNSSRSSAEWIVERPNVNDKITFLANFGTMNFNDSYAMVGDKVEAISSFLYSKVIMTNDLSEQLASVSPLNNDGTSFSVTYMRSS
jgi:hypothetical protein